MSYLNNEVPALPICKIKLKRPYTLNLHNQIVSCTW